MLMLPFLRFCYLQRDAGGIAACAVLKRALAARMRRYLWFLLKLTISVISQYMS
uniref:Uncharacterized protein n=1 Tax=Setaria italica TaxID=4555 RepID=K3ZZ04_SETIT